jgi:hypothetical protein
MFLITKNIVYYIFLTIGMKKGTFGKLILRFYNEKGKIYGALTYLYFLVIVEFRHFFTSIIDNSSAILLILGSSALVNIAIFTSISSTLDSLYSNCISLFSSNELNDDTV